jgi:hypothetical protein
MSTYLSDKICIKNNDQTERIDNGVYVEPEIRKDSREYHRSLNYAGYESPAVARLRYQTEEAGWAALAGPVTIRFKEVNSAS